MSSIAVDTSRASEELTTAADYQRKAGRRAACLMIVVVIVVAIVLLAVSSQIPSFDETLTISLGPFINLYLFYLPGHLNFCDTCDFFRDRNLLL